ncbi:MAG: NAD(P)/FAD-dependent oxidoreductase [Eubacteriales bacterium]|nr:NAD(P)/FAD-dependent oxidoreductase [Eubacteriales bacterium]
MSNVFIIGGGPAGIIAAITAAQNGKTVILADRNNILCRKMRITGKGRCNITNSCDMEAFISAVVSNPYFLYSSFYSFTNNDIIALLNKLGVETKEERGGRIFPVSDSAKTVADALINYAHTLGVKFLKNTTIKKILVKDNKAVGVIDNSGNTYYCDSVITACGGASYPLTGSDGNGYKLLKLVGHSIIDIKPSLVPLETIEEWVSEISGLALRNIKVSFYCNGNKKPVYEDFGEMLFAHFGVTGPVVLSASSHLRDFNSKKYTMTIDLKPALDYDALDNRVQRDFAEYVNKNYENALSKLLPKSLIPVIVELSGIDKYKKVNQITKEERQKLVSLLKNLPLTIKGTRPIGEAIITAGGINTDEVNPSTMESRIINNLYIAGEMLDVDAYTGGFNLQIAYSTGYLAGLNA